MVLKYRVLTRLVYFNALRGQALFHVTHERCMQRMCEIRNDDLGEDKS